LQNYKTGKSLFILQIIWQILYYWSPQPERPKTLIRHVTHRKTYISILPQFTNTHYTDATITEAHYSSFQTFLSYSVGCYFVQVFKVFASLSQIYEQTFFW